MASTTCYRVEQVPENPVAWNRLENANGHGLRALLLSSLAESVEELWQALDRLPANCAFIVTELIRLNATAQIKASMQDGMILAMRSREEESTPLIEVFTACAIRLNQEPLRKRLLRHWDETSLVRKERIEQETHTLEWVPFMHKIKSTPLNDEAEQTIEAAKAVLGMIGWQSAYSYAMHIVRLFPNTVAPAMARAFLQDLEEMEKVATAHLEKADSEIYREVEQGHCRAFSQLLREASALLSPLLLERDAAGPPVVIVFEYDLTYHGGDYSDVGAFVSLPGSLIERLGGDYEQAFESFTGYARSHVIHYSTEEEEYDEKDSGPLASQVPHRERLAHYATCALCQGLIQEMRQRVKQTDATCAHHL